MGEWGTVGGGRCLSGSKPVSTRVHPCFETGVDPFPPVAQGCTPVPVPCAGTPGRPCVEAAAQGAAASTPAGGGPESPIRVGYPAGASWPAAAANRHPPAAIPSPPPQLSAVPVEAGGQLVGVGRDGCFEAGGQLSLKYYIILYYIIFDYLIL